MDRTQAINLFREIGEKLPELYPEAVSILESQPNDPLATGSIIEVKGLSKAIIEQVKEIVKNYSLATQENQNNLTIYTPKTAQALPQRKDCRI